MKEAVRNKTRDSSLLTYVSISGSCEEGNFWQVPFHHSLLVLVMLVCLWVHNKKSRFFAAGFDSADDLLMIFVADVSSIHLYDTIPLFESSRLCG